MCKIVEEIAKEAAKTVLDGAVNERNLEIAKKSLLKGHSIEDTADITDLPIEVVKELACELKENK